MPLPIVPAWLVDYATAREVMDGQDARLRDAFALMCAAGTLKFCACEQSSFRSHALTRQHFCDDQNCRCNLSSSIAEIASALPDSLGGKKHHPSDSSARMIVACAIDRNYGILSIRSGGFISPIELGLAQGLTCLKLPEFAALI